MAAYRGSGEARLGESGRSVGLQPHPQVRDEMARFMAEVAPLFANA
jgi:hypothetical protein